MMTLIIGGSGSGKSAYAENYIVSLSEKKKKYYIATMQVYDEEGEKKIERHQALRSGKGFYTIEQPKNICKAAEKMEAGGVALLECMSNLTANEMFSEEMTNVETAKREMPKKEFVTEKIVRDISLLKKKLTHLVIVSNNVFEDGKIYDKTTMEYIQAMGQINQRLAAMADEVIEMVAGIPLVVKSSKAAKERKKICTY